MKITILFFSFLFACTIVSAQTKIKSATDTLTPWTKAKGSIPDDFIGSKDIVMFDGMNNDDVTDAFTEAVEKYYTGPYRITSFSMKPKKGDVYTFRWSVNVEEHYSGHVGITGHREGVDTDYSISLWDHKERKIYYSSWTDGRYKKVIVRFIKQLEKKRLGGKEED